ncbi:glycosyltransferase family 2 protein [Pedobacter glucosidilyticus]|uniref:glycosyltransferase family 2 protein n=1 Tax=Pedobacter glucosidilyticus TaxID=1122941 RepID=UPI00040756D3|nr:glycosyltransferase [Pedobacter glucosidilyticus]
MLSILVPHYNFINQTLFTELEQQCLSLSLDFEIIVIDDASLSSYKNYLNQFNKPYFNIIFLDKNIGRSAIRNLLAAKASYPFLLFLDGDSCIKNPNFIKNYLNFIQQNPAADLVCGLRNYPECLNKEYLLHHYYGTKVEMLASKQAFHSSNFLIKKEVFKALQFDERLTHYGYEDVVFGLTAKAKGYTIKNFDNPVIHLQLKTNQQFMADTEDAVQNLAQLMQLPQYEIILKEIPLIRIYLLFKKTGLWHLLAGLKSRLRKNMEQEKPNATSIKKLQLYKLLHLHYCLS